MIFDCHVHPPDLSKTYANPVPPDMPELLARMDACNIDRVMLLGSVAVSQFPTPDQITQVNTHTINAVNHWPDRFSGLCYLNPSHDPSFTLNEMQRCIADGPLVGVKLWIALNARDPQHDPLMQRCAQLDCMVLYHAWHKTVGRQPQESDPTDIAHLAKRHPEVRILMAHMMGAGVRGISDIANCPNVSVDVSGSPPTAGVLEYALQTIGHERILFGSDWPIRDFATQLGKLDEVGLTDSQREDLLWGNLHRMLGGHSPC